jgi:predicted SAM-dependent methyltransferase
MHDRLARAPGLAPLAEEQDRAAPAPMRLNWGCGRRAVPGWINSDIASYPGVDIVRDIRHGLPIADQTLDYIVSVHALVAIPYDDLVPVLAELRRMLRPGGVLRLVLPDFDKAIRAYLAGDKSYFLIGDDEEPTVSGKLVAQLLWYGTNRVFLNAEFMRDLLRRASFGETRLCAFRETGSAFADITAFDNRQRESFIVEAVRTP